MSTADDWTFTFKRRARRFCCRRVGCRMTAFLKWLRRRAVTAPPRSKTAPSPVRWSFCGVSAAPGKTSAAETGAECTREIMQRITSNRFFEIRY
jgi:hypothetical protein